MKVHAFRLLPGDDLMLGIEKFVNDNAITAGYVYLSPSVILSALLHPTPPHPTPSHPIPSHPTLRLSFSYFSYFSNTNMNIDHNVCGECESAEPETCQYYRHAHPWWTWHHLWDSVSRGSHLYPWWSSTYPFLFCFSLLFYFIFMIRELYDELRYVCIW